MERTIRAKLLQAIEIPPSIKESQNYAQRLTNLKSKQDWRLKVITANEKKEGNQEINTTLVTESGNS